MHVPGHNPYITQDDPYAIDWVGSGGATGSFDLPFYQYQGLSPDIMSALTNIFSPGAGDVYNLGHLMTGALGIEGLYDPTITFGDEGTTVGGGWEMDFGDLGNVSDSFSTPLEGIEGALPFTDVFDPESLAATLSTIGGLTGLPGEDLGAIRPGEVKALTPEMIEKTTAAYYDPIEDVGRQKLIGEKTKALGKAATGGFAGSGARASGLSGAEQVYRGGYGKLLEGIMGQQAGATENVMDTIYGWQELLGNQ